MSIPALQLQTWSNQGATDSAKRTHQSIRHALEQYNWRSDITYEAYLQGSYRNATNIRGDSDVDLVVELTSTFYSNLTNIESEKLGITTATYGWHNFHTDAISALSKYYGPDYIDPSKKSVKVLPKSGRIKADVVIAATYRYYENMAIKAEGITFFLPSGQQIYNYPKLHYQNGTHKNNTQRTNQKYKPLVRMFKNARNRIIENTTFTSAHFPSYFIECLLYNAPNELYDISSGLLTYRPQNTFERLLNWLNDEIYGNNWQKFVCQNEMYYLFGDSTVQWNIDSARQYVGQLIKLWNDWK